MTPDIASLIQACEWSSSKFLIFSDNVFAPLIYYSHLGTIIPTVLIAVFILINGRRELASVLLFLTTAFFSLWVYSDLVLWANEYPSYIMFFWALEIICEPLVYFFGFYFFYSFVFKKDLSWLKKILFFIPLIPTFALAATRFSLLGYDLSNCDRAASEGILATYGYGIEIFYALLIVIFAAYSWIKNKELQRRNQTILLALGITAFLLSFSLGNIVEVFTEEWSIGQWGLFGAPVFVAFLAYIIVRFKAFNVRLIGAQVLVATLWLLTLALLFVRTIENVRIVVAVTLIFVLIIGILLVRSVEREIKQRQHIEKLAQDLSAANERQVSLIHFITHQIKGFVTKSRNAMAGILEGDYGQAPETMRPLIQQVFDSDTQGVSTIQEILNASNIKSGKVSYTMAPFDLKGLLEEVVATLKGNADKKGLALNANLGSEALTVNGDRAQLVNAYKNIIDNSIKYTPKGSVTVSLEKKADKALFIVTDTGVGISEEDKKSLFTEGGHGKESTKVNVDSTGFGLYIVKNIIDAHKGRVWAKSDGPGKGSRFYIELPA